MDWRNVWDKHGREILNGLVVLLIGFVAVGGWIKYGMELVLAAGLIVIAIGMFIIIKLYFDKREKEASKEEPIKEQQPKESPPEVTPSPKSTFKPLPIKTSFYQGDKKAPSSMGRMAQKFDAKKTASIIHSINESKKYRVQSTTPRGHPERGLPLKSSPHKDRRTPKEEAKPPKDDKPYTEHEGHALHKGTHVWYKVWVSKDKPGEYQVMETSEKPLCTVCKTPLEAKRKRYQNPWLFCPKCGKTFGEPYKPDKNTYWLKAHIGDNLRERGIIPDD